MRKTDTRERLRDIPAQAKQRAEDGYVALSAYRLDPDDQRFPRAVEVFNRALGWVIIALGAIEICYQVVLYFIGGR
jgi:hypothetical protein